MKFLIILFVCILNIAASSSASAAGQYSYPKDFPLPKVPDSISDTLKRADFVATHFWDNFDFSGNQSDDKNTLIEQAFVDFIDLFRLTASDRLPEYVSNLTSKAESNPEAAEFIYDLADKYIATKDSPMRNEEHHILFLQNAVKSEALGEAGRERAKYRLIAEMKNRPGMTASDFNLETRDGKTSTLSGLLSNDYNLVVFYDPDCNHCLETMDELKKMSLPDTLAIIAIDVVEDKMTWDNTKHSLPEDWTIAFSLDPIQDDELYIFDEMPSLYLIDRSGTILMKDTSCTDIMHTRL